jgi:D-lactate dehydrogenase (cytochrome)
MKGLHLKIEDFDFVYTGEKMNALIEKLSDESRREGSAAAIAMPNSEAEIEKIIQFCFEQDTQITVSSGLTGIAAGAVPESGIAMNMSNMDNVTKIRESEGEFFLTCQPCVSLAALRTMIHEKDFRGMEDWEKESLSAFEVFKKSPEQTFPVDPTETSACIGGMAACNASGARSYFYGAMRKYITAIRGITPTGKLFLIKRGEHFVNDKLEFSFPLLNGESIKEKIPSYTMPEIKNAAGYFAKPGMDIIDLLIGSDGTLAVFTEIELKLVKAPENILGIVLFAQSEEVALRIVHDLKGETKLKLPQPPLAIEYFDYRAVQMLRNRKNSAEGCEEIPHIPDNFHTAIYFEFAGDEDTLEECTIAIAEIMERENCSEEAAWMATEEREHEKLKAFRHAIPETVNMYIGQIRKDFPEITKLGTDMAVEDRYLDDTIRFYRSTLEENNLHYVIFGHIGDSHLHVNILPSNTEEYKKGKDVYLKFAKRICKLGGTVSAEHGVGKLKKFLLPVMYGEEGTKEMKSVKKVFDPKGILGRGTLFNLD